MESAEVVPVHSGGVRRGSQEEKMLTSALEDEQGRGEG